MDMTLNKMLLLTLLLLFLPPHFFRASLLTLFRMGIFAAAHGWGGASKKGPLP